MGAVAQRCTVGDARATGRSYRRRRPEKTVLYEIVRRNLETFLDDGRQRTEHGFGYPRYVERTFRRYLACGLPSEGLARVKCESCGFEHWVAFSCKQRAVCPSCQARRMADTAQQLCTSLLPQAPYRQYVFTFPVPLRLCMARDPKVLSALLRCSIRAHFAHLRARARARGVTAPMPAALSMIQTMGGYLNSNVHFHVLSPDGVFALGPDDTLQFTPLGAPSTTDIEQLTRAVARRVGRWAVRHLDPDAQPPDDDEAALRAVTACEAQLPAPPWWLPREPKVRTDSTRCATVDGFSVHANTSVAADARSALQHLLRYGLRAPLSTERLSLLDDGRVRYRFRRPYSDGSTHLELDPVAFMRRLALSIPPPRINLLRYHGLFASRAKHRNKLAQLLPQPQRVTRGTDTDGLHDQPAVMSPLPQLPPRTRMRWAALLAHVFAIDVLTCPKCQGKLRLIALIKEAQALAKICEHLGWPTAAPACQPVGLAPQLTFDELDATADLDAIGQLQHRQASARDPPPARWVSLAQS